MSGMLWSGCTLLIVGSLASTSPAQPWMPDDVQIGASAVSYIDPEFLPSGMRIVFQDSHNNVWVGDLDRDTGDLVSPDGCDYFIDSEILPVSMSLNGPEWGEDRYGPALFYAKRDGNGISQIWRAAPPFGQPTLTQLTRGLRSSIGQLTLLHPAGASTRISFVQPSGQRYVWIDEENPTALRTLEGPTTGPARWVHGTYLLTYTRLEGPPGQKFGQIVLVDTVSEQTRVITNDAGHKRDAFGFFAPEFDGELLVMANLDGEALAVYRDLGAPDGFWTRIAELRTPPTSPYRELTSAEPLAGNRGVGGQSYFTVLASAAPEDTSIWVLGLGTDPQARFARRVDGGALESEPRLRREPESLIGRREAFVYYSVRAAGGATQLRRCRTGLFVLPGDLNCDDIVNLDDIDPFVLALSDPFGYQQAFPECHRFMADINLDGEVDFGDIDPFVRLLTNP